MAASASSAANAIDGDPPQPVEPEREQRGRERRRRRQPRDALDPAGQQPSRERRRRTGVGPRNTATSSATSAIPTTMLSSGLERSMTRWKLEPNVSPRYSNTEPWPSMMFGALSSRSNTCCALGGPCSVSATSTIADGPTHSMVGIAIRAAAPCRARVAAIDHQHEPRCDDERRHLAGEGAHREHGTGDERHPGGGDRTRADPQSDQRDEEEGEQVRTALAADRVERERRHDQCAGGGVGDDRATTGEHHDQRDHRRDRRHRHDVLHEVDGGDGRTTADDRAQDLAGEAAAHEPVLVGDVPERAAVLAHAVARVREALDHLVRDRERRARAAARARAGGAGGPVGRLRPLPAPDHRPTARHPARRKLGRVCPECPRVAAGSKGQVGA